MTLYARINRPIALVVALAAAIGLVAWDSPAHADGPKVMFVPHTTLPFPLRRAVPRALAARAEIVSNRTYLTRCNANDVRPGSYQAIRRFGVRSGADVIAVVGWRAWGRSRQIRVTWRDGNTGASLLSTRHNLPGVRLDASARRGLAREVLAAARVAGGSGGGGDDERVARSSRSGDSGEDDSDDAEEASSSSDDEGGLPPPVDWEEGEEAAGSSEALEEEDAEEEDAEEEDGELGARRTGFGFDATAGFGFGARASSVPMEAGPARLSTSPFPAGNLGLGAGYRGTTVGFGARARYFTSVGLRTKEMRNDGTTRTVDARSQTLQIGLAVNFALSDQLRPTMLELEVGYHFRLFNSELPLAMPEYTLSGIYARVDLSFPVGSGPLRLAITPEIASVNGITEQLQEMGKVNAGVAVGGEAAIRFDLLEQLRLEVVYRESHAFITSERETDMTDVERYGMLRATYMP